MDSLPPTIIDIEASGFGAASYPIEVGCVLADGESFCTLIYPQPDWQHWDSRAEALHGIRRETLLRCGKAPSVVATTLNDKLNGLTVYTDSWYHDYTWLSRLFDAADTSPHFNLQDLRVWLDRTDTRHWDEAKQAVVAELQLSRHRASNDARILQQTVMRIAQIA
ncbi:3'-5' exonuclease [Chitinimonas naiadis]